uniref:Uncharacterized protein n=1 Tax=Aegilops tauschii subsp. strangulata TaxID=200361 RepID=A0A453AD27_AEGTS
IIMQRWEYMAWFPFLCYVSVCIWDIVTSVLYKYMASLLLRRLTNNLQRT